MFKLILLSLFFTTQAYAAVWYYGTGEAVNLENQIGFENAQDIKIFTDGLVLSTSFDNGTTVQSLDRQIEVGELIPNNGFERSDLTAVSCTNATTARVADVSGGQFNDWALQITATGTPWSCDIDGAGGSGTGFAQLQSIATVGADAEFCILANGVEVSCHQSTILTSQSETFSIPTVLDGTENSIRIKGTSASNIVTADRASMKAGQLSETGYFREEVITLVNSGTNNIDGVVKVTSDGLQIQIDVISELTHDTDSNIATASNVIPSWACPVDGKSNISHIDVTGTSVFRMFYVNGSTNGNPCSLGVRYLTSSLGAANKTNAGLQLTLSYNASEAQTVKSFNSMIYRSDLLAISSTGQDITSEATVTFSGTPQIHNGTFSSNQFTVGQSGYYSIFFRSVIRKSAANDSGLNVASFISVNGVNESIPCTRELRFTISALAGAGGGGRTGMTLCNTKKFLNANDVVSIRASSTLEVTFQDRAFEITPILNPSGEPASLVVDGYTQAPRISGNQPKECTIRQISATTTASFTEVNDCLSASSRSAVGRTSVTLNTGYFGAEEGDCFCQAVNATGTGEATCTIISTDFPIDFTDPILIRTRVSGADTDVQYSLSCKGAAP